jgi:3-oxoacyl-[acyl-carrier protein] reductase/(S)-1-phenylethanol dehydrogenase
MKTKGTAVITGAANGLGQAHAVRLAKDGFDIAVADIVEPNETRKLVESQGKKFFSSIVDVTSEEATKDFAIQVKEEMGIVTALINNAGIYPHALFSELDFKLWKKILDINLDGTFLMSKAFVPQMIENNYGRIVNVASTTFFMNVTHGSAYLASKGGVIGLSRGLASEVGADGITVNVIAPWAYRYKNE